MQRRRQCTLAQCLAGLAAIQLACAAASGAFGPLVQVASLTLILLAAASIAHLLGEAAIDLLVDGLARSVGELPLNVRASAASRFWPRPF